MDCIAIICIVSITVCFLLYNAELDTVGEAGKGEVIARPCFGSL